MNSSSEAQRFLDKGPPWAGDSKFSDKDLLKNNGARWSSELKKWTAPSESALFSLLRTNKWHPATLDRGEELKLISLLKDQGIEQHIQDVNVRSLPRPARPVTFERAAGERFNPVNDTQKVATGFVYVFAQECPDCHFLLDSRMQFGFECMCAPGERWGPCVSCLRPIKRAQKMLCSSCATMQGTRAVVGA